jgi:hypothetical protein
MNRDDRRKLEAGAGAPGRKAQADARQDGGPDHKTGAMKKGRHGAYL